MKTIISASMPSNAEYPVAAPVILLTRLKPPPRLLRSKDCLSSTLYGHAGFLARDGNAVRRAQQGSLIRLAGRHLGDDLAAEQNDGAVADQADLRKLGGEQQHGRPGVGHLAQQAIDLMLRSDIDAARWIEAKQRLEPTGDPSRNRNFLLVAATQSAQFGSRTGVDLQPLDRGGDALALAMEPNQTPFRRVAYERQRHVLMDRSLRQKRLESILPEPGQALRLDRVAWVVQRVNFRPRATISPPS